jgi:hypothetical protein
VLRNGQQPAEKRRPAGYDCHVKGDRVEVIVDTGGGSQTFDVVATRAGRRVEVSTARGVVQVNEVTRSGATVRAARFMSARVIAVVEHPADQTASDRSQPRLEQQDTLL